MTLWPNSASELTEKRALYHAFATMGSTNRDSVSQGNRIQVSYLMYTHLNKWLIHKAFSLISIDNRKFTDIQ